MSEILYRYFHYERVNPTTWAYLSSLLSLALFFKFNRFWTLRNLDLVLLILLAPALLCIKLGLEQTARTPGELNSPAGQVEEFGYIWLLSVNGLLLVRMLLDPAMVRRPLLEANLTTGGTLFLGVSLLLFLFANVINGVPTEADLYAAQRAEYLANLESSELENDNLARYGPGFTLFYFLPHISTQRLLGPEPPQVSPDQEDAVAQAAVADPQISTADSVTARVVAILSQLMIVAGVVLVAGRHFGASETGVSAATLYLMLPYTAMWTGASTHALPGALLVWAILFYRRPLVAGMLFGFLCGTIYYPVFLLPLWTTFYWRRGVRRFWIGLLCAIGVLMLTLAFTAESRQTLLEGLQQMFNLRLPPMDGLAGVWSHWNPRFRVPLFALFVGLSFSFILWPAQKNLGTLLSCSSALMIGTQFWHAHSSGGMALAWYLPVLLLTVFRPNLEDRNAVDVVARSSWGRAKATRVAKRPASKANAS